MTSESLSPASASAPIPRDVAFPIAPSFSPRISLRFLLPALVALAVSPWPLLLGIRFGWVMAYLVPWVVFIVLMSRGEAITSEHKPKYVERLLKANKLKGIKKNKEAAEARFAASEQPPDVTMFLAIGAWIYLAIVHGVIFYGEDRSYSTWESTLGAVWHWFMFLFQIPILFLWCFSFNGAIRDTSDFRGAFDEVRESLILQDHERNDLEIGRMRVSLQAMIRRVDAYTIESTLLSALALSAFIGISYSDQGPLEPSSWLQDMSWSCAKYNLLFTKEICIPAAGGDVGKHIMYVICFFMLICATFFMAVLVTRLRFNDGSRDVEEVIGALDILNEMENRAGAERGKKYSAEIAELIQRARIGVDSLKPTLGFMKIFRGLGIGAFISAAAVCGLNFNPLVSLVILMTFLAAFFFSFADRMRHDFSFIRRLETTVLGKFGR